MNALGFVEAERTRDGIQNAVRGHGYVTALQLCVVVDADPREISNLLATQAWDSPKVSFEGKQPDLLRGELRAAGLEEVACFASPVHRTEATSETA